MYHFSSQNNEPETVRLSQHISIPNDLCQYLKKFQIEAIRFMHALLVKDKFCIYNDESGLGKQAATVVLLSVIAINRKTLIVIQNDERYLTGWEFHLNVLSQLRVKVIKDEQDLRHNLHNVYVITWGTLRAIDEVNNYKFDYIILDNRGQMMNNNFCTSVLLRHFRGKTNLIISSVDVTSKVKLLHNILLLGGCLEPQYLAYKHFEEKFKLPQSMELSCKTVDLDKYFRERQRLSDYCKNFRLRRYCHQYEDDLPLVLENHYKVILNLWRERQNATNSEDSNVVYASRDKIQIEKSTQELFEDFCRQKQYQSKKQTENQRVNLSEEQLIHIENDMEIIMDSPSEDLVNMPPLLIESDSDNDIVTVIADTNDIGQREIVDITNDQNDPKNSKTINNCPKKKARNELEGLAHGIAEKYKYDFNENDQKNYSTQCKSRRIINNEYNKSHSYETTKSANFPSNLIEENSINKKNKSYYDAKRHKEGNLQETGTPSSSNSIESENIKKTIEKNDVLSNKKLLVGTKAKKKNLKRLLSTDRRETRTFRKRLTRSSSSAISINHVSLTSDRSSKRKNKNSHQNSLRKKEEEIVKINDEKDTQTPLFIHNSDSNDYGNMQCAQKLSDSSIYDNFINSAGKKENLVTSSNQFINTPLLAANTNTSLSGSEVIFMPCKKSNISEIQKNLQQNNINVINSSDNISLSPPSSCTSAISRRTKALKPKRMHNHHSLNSINKEKTCNEFVTKRINSDTANLSSRETYINYADLTNKTSFENFNILDSQDQRLDQMHENRIIKETANAPKPTEGKSCLVILEKMFNINKSTKSPIADNIITKSSEKVNDINTFDIVPSSEDVYEITDSDTYGSFIRVHLNGDMSTMPSNIQRNQSAQHNKITNYLITGNASKDLSNMNNVSDNLSNQNVRMFETNYSPNKRQQLTSSGGSISKKSPKTKVRAQATKLTKWFLKHVSVEQSQHIENVQLNHNTINDNDNDAIIKTPSSKKQIKRRRLDLNFKT
uniref:SNF2 N-terminal domain-containing protein n=1 Tax=Glossina brevipalpis TaxID=37001 RepID=A0A1A9WE99_9MUSC